MFLNSPDVLWIDVTLDKTIIEKTVVANAIVFVFVFAFLSDYPTKPGFSLNRCCDPLSKFRYRNRLGQLLDVGPTKWNVKRIFEKK